MGLPGIDLGAVAARQIMRLDEAKAMNCDSARDSVILAAYGELPDEQLIGLEQHLMSCEACMAEFEAMRRELGVVVRSYVRVCVAA